VIAKANAAFLYLGANYDTSGAGLVGRQSASEGFLRAMARHGGVETLYCLCNVKEEFDDFTARVAAYTGGSRPTAWISPPTLAELAKPGCLFRPGPDIGSLAWQRRHFGPELFSLCGITHTTADHPAMDALGALVSSPLEEWDALICTSQSVKKMVERLLANQADWLGELCQASPPAPPFRRPVIPLGVACEEFEGHSDNGLRDRLGIGQDEIAFLYVGRMTHVEKSNPLPMHLALQQVAEKCTRKLHLIMAGWFATPELEDAFKATAKLFSPAVTCHFLDGRLPEIRRHIWFAADIFISLSDNIQETFGLTPIEAMAAGLPVLAGDWDGYRESVRNGVEGILVPTLAPPPGAGADIAYLHASGFAPYDVYTGATSQSTAIDVAACREAALSLSENPELRRNLGEAGKLRARAVYDWRHVITAYQELWQELAEIRQSGKSRFSKRLNPTRDDPYALFSHYPSFTLSEEMEIELALGFSLEALSRLYASPIGCPLPSLLLPPPAIASLVEKLSSGPKSIKKLGNNPSNLATIGWLAKMGLLKASGFG
jgi:starch synthase